MKFTTGVKNTAPKVLIYGNSGVGKSTLASKFSRPVFLDIEGGLNFLDVTKTDHVIRKVSEVYEVLQELFVQAKGTRQFDTIVIDSADWLVRLIAEQVAGIGMNDDGTQAKTMAALTQTLNKNLMDAAGGFGKAKEVLENHIRSMLLPYLQKLNEAGYGIVLIAHQYAVSTLDDEGMEMERVQPKIDPPTIGKKPIAMPAIVEWVDTVLYLKKRGSDRLVQVEGDDNVVAKNRIGLTGEHDLAEIDINELLKIKQEKATNKKGDK